MTEIIDKIEKVILDHCHDDWNARHLADKIVEEIDRNLADAINKALGTDD